MVCMFSLSLVSATILESQEIEIRRAVELILPTTNGVDYELQRSEDLRSWKTEELVLGTGVSESRFRSSGELPAFYRLLALPIVTSSIPQQSGVPGEEMVITLADRIFENPVNGALRLSVTLSGGNALPSWLHYDALSQTLIGTPSEVDVGQVLIEVTAETPQGGRRHVEFSIVVGGISLSDEEFVVIPAGPFAMGDALGDGFSDERPVHEINVSAFLVQSTEVSLDEWNRVASWASEQGYDISIKAASDSERFRAVHGVSWFECIKYANARSEMEGLVPVYYEGSHVLRTAGENPEIRFDATGYRLPTEAEWEKAARGGLNGMRYPWGDTITHDQANYYSSTLHHYDISNTRESHPDYPFVSSPVGSFLPNGFGLYDVTGNVFEWCSDWHSDLYYSMSPTQDPRGPETGDQRVIRGGSFVVNANLNRISYRDGSDPTMGGFGIGFRLVKRSFD